FETFFGGGMGAGGIGGTGGMGGMGGRAGGAGRRAQAPMARDAESEVTIPLAEAYRGGTRVLELSEPDGTSRRLEVKIPAGVNDGARIRIAGQGFQGPAGRGDLYLRVHVLPDTHFAREGTTLRTRVDVPLTTAMLGGEIMVPTPDGRRLALRVPAGTANGRAFRLRGQGMPAVGKPEQRGDLYADVNVTLPTHLNDEQRRLFAAFARSLEESSQQTGRREEGVHG
ncbi:MAG TPA: J domain-containing protein, partial [Ktedonobacteraceae bacterium]|nr:J domain-containing protein [Ktedonobacteraceae bacterium]